MDHEAVELTGRGLIAYMCFPKLGAFFADAYAEAYHSGREREIYLDVYIYMCIHTHMHICISLVGGISQLATMVGCRSMRSPLLAPPPSTGMELFFAWGMRAGTVHAGTLAPPRILEILLGYRVYEVVRDFLLP